MMSFFVYLYPKLMTRITPMIDWQDFDELLALTQFDDAPCGGALAIYHQGKQVVNTATGLALPDMAWTTDTLSVNFSIGKGVMATLIAILVSKGLLDYQMPIAHYWQAFAKQGKQHIRLIDVLTHTAGLFDVRSVASDTQTLIDWQAMTDLVAQMPTSTPAGQESKHYASAYSALVSGWILGGLVERVTGLSLQAALDEYLAKPLGLVGQLYYGVPSDKLHLIAKPERYFDPQTADAPRRKPTLKPDSDATKKTLGELPVTPLWQQASELTTANINRLYFDTSQMNLVNYKNALMPNGRDGLSYHSDEVLTAIIPAANGVSTANALATIYAMHANDGIWHDQTLINAQTLAQMQAIYTDGFDAVMPANMRWRAGFHRVFSLQNASQAYGHMGYNGSVAFCDPSRQLSFAFIHNYDTTMLNDIRQFILSEMALSLV